MVTRRTASWKFFRILKLTWKKNFIKEEAHPKSLLFRLTVTEAGREREREIIFFLIVPHLASHPENWSQILPAKLPISWPMISSLQWHPSLPLGQFILNASTWWTQPSTCKRQWPRTHTTDEGTSTTVTSLYWAWPPLAWVNYSESGFVYTRNLSTTFGT